MMMLLPAGTGSVATEFANVAVPSARLPAEKVTVPAGVPLPERGFTAAVRLAAVAVTVVEVPIGAGATVTTTEPAELLKFPVAV
jgi:hypothetical protein